MIRSAVEKWYAELALERDHKAFMDQYIKDLMKLQKARAGVRMGLEPPRFSPERDYALDTIGEDILERQYNLKLKARPA